MIQSLAALLGAVTAFVLILAALVYIVNPKQGRELMHRLAVFFVGALVGLCLLRQYAGYIGVLCLILFGLGITVLAYVIYTARHDAKPRDKQRRGAERTPLVPSGEAADHE